VAGVNVVRVRSRGSVTEAGWSWREFIPVALTASVAKHLIWFKVVAMLVVRKAVEEVQYMPPTVQHLLFIAIGNCNLQLKLGS